MSTTKNLKNKITSRSQGEFPPKQDMLDTCIGTFLYSFTSVRTPSPVPLSSCFHPISMTLWKDPLARHLSNSTKVSQVWNTTGTPLDSIVFHRVEAATDPRAKHQALAPSLPMKLRHKLMFITVLLTFNASARACGQKRCQTKPCHVKPENLQGDLRH